MVHVQFPIIVVFRYILAYGYFLEVLYTTQILNLLVQWQMLVSALLVSIFAVVDIEPLLDPSIHAKEFDKNLVALHIVEYIEVDEIRYERR